MNITLREVYQTNADGDVFWKLKECYIRGSTVRGGRWDQACIVGLTCFFLCLSVTILLGSNP